jgi:acyl-CoA oxidase
MMQNCDILSCYGQTEIGHGTDVQGLKTTATYDKAKKEFIIHTPSPDATKWWPGDMGRTANYALIVAKIIIPDEDGEVNDYGLGMFMV